MYYKNELIIHHLSIISYFIDESEKVILQNLDFNNLSLNF